MKRLLMLFIILFAVCVEGSNSMAQAADRPAVVIAGFQSRVENSNLKISKEQFLPTVAEVMSTALTGNQKFDLYSQDTDTVRARLDEVSIMNNLGKGIVEPELQSRADYVIFGYLTNLSGVKAQSGVAILGGGKDQTVHAELSMRVVDAHTGAVVFATTSSARRKGELQYNAAILLKRKDSGLEDAVAAALAAAAVDLAEQFKQAI